MIEQAITDEAQRSALRWMHEMNPASPTHGYSGTCLIITWALAYLIVAWAHQ